MKKIISTLAWFMFITGTAISSCQSSAENPVVAKFNLQDAKHGLQTGQQNADTVKTAKNEEWNKFRSECEVKINSNEIRIAGVNEKMKKPGSSMNQQDIKRLYELEQKNNDLKTKLNSYQKDQSDWDTFRQKFQYDLDAVGQALKDLTTDNK